MAYICNAITSPSFFEIEHIFVPQRVKAIFLSTAHFRGLDEHPNETGMSSIDYSTPIEEQTLLTGKPGQQPHTYHKVKIDPTSTATSTHECK